MMRLPQIRIPLPSLVWLSVFGGRTAWMYIGYTTLMFLVCLLITFPRDELIKRALSSVNRGPLDFQIGETGFAWHRGYEVANLRVGVPNGEGQAPLFETTRLFVRPSFSNLLHGNPYAASISADLYGGTLQGDVVYKDGGFSGTLNWNNLNLGKYTALTGQLQEGQVAGDISGQITFEARGVNFGQGQATGEMILDGGALTKAKVSGWPIPDLHLQQTKAKFKVGSGRVELQDVIATGDVSLQGSGQIVLKDPVGESVLNLRATITATPQTPDPIKGALALIPRQPGAKPDAPVTITGTLSRPRLR